METCPSTGTIPGSLNYPYTFYLLLDHLLIDFAHYRGMRQKRYESVEKMLDLLDVVKRIGPKFPLDALFLDPHDRKTILFSSNNFMCILAEWDDDMTYLYVDYPLYKKYTLFVTLVSVSFTLRP